MTINNQNRAAWIKLSYYLGTFIYLSLTILLIYLSIPNIYIILGAMSILFFTLIIFSLFLNYNFIIFQESDDFIILRYYPLHPFHDNFKSIEISRNSLSHYDWKNKIFGLRPELTLYQQTTKGVAKYPAVSLSAITKADRKKVKAILNKNILTQK
ncbi:hypothetical protein [Ancylomarina longa]|uniref:Uncharacterized protein n=1 Tax=Ancylomarina longa TaxID=2487017 RepID=A0A434AUH6_9BACT|nr:hypothetical protein [Ancylomarina longa]RUT78102.1 hypothetical protein DLK05_09655 [Ancylomarina longa]